MLKGFKDFILRGNVIDLAVAVVIGAAFTAVVNTIVESLVQPVIRIIMGGSSDGAVGGTFTIRGEVIDIAAITGAFITFLITAAVVYFIFVAPMNRAKAVMAARSGHGGEAASEPEDIVLLREIRDALKGIETSRSDVDVRSAGTPGDSA